MEPTSPSTPPSTILYIAGAGRSGSTILDNILGQVEGVASVGELRFLWERGILEGRLCGCGRPFLECPQWDEILAAAFPDADLRALARRMVELQQAGTRARRLPKLLRRRPRERLQQIMSEYLGNLSRLYAAAATHLGVRVLVDSSKLPPYGALLDMLPGVEVRVVHLIRDPRATAYSWLRKKVLPDRAGTAFMQQQGPVKASALWALWNTAAGLLWPRSTRSLRVHYEAFVQDPRTVVERVLAHAGVEATDTPFVTDTEVELSPNHTVAGNPSRFATGRVAIRADDEWTTKMARWDRLRVTAVTWPLLLRYGYPVRPTRTSPPAAPRRRTQDRSGDPGDVGGTSS
jgi:sulfotransferase family protein